MRSILLIDDKADALDELARRLRDMVSPDIAEIRKWLPTEADRDARAAFETQVDPQTTLVITDSDLTSQGQTGLFGASIVAWCQQKSIPVGDYSRKPYSITKEPELFELRVPAEPEEAAGIIGAIFKGFRDIGDRIDSDDELLRMRSPSAVLAKILGQPEIESQLALYAVRISAASGELMGQLMEAHDQDKSPSVQNKRKLLTYITGHLLLNVLRFPGPILKMEALKAYVASNDAGTPDVLRLLEPARYAGPFSELDSYFWVAGVDSVLDDLLRGLPAELETETSGELYRRALENALDGRELVRHTCSRCDGRNGGFYCPFTNRTVCQLPECSVGSNSWIPQGAKICRIEREFFDEWSPILGL